MAEEKIKEKTLKEKPADYIYAHLAEQFAKEGKQEYVQEAIKKFRKEYNAFDFGVHGKYLKINDEGWANEKQVEGLLKVYSGAYNQVIVNANISEIYDWHKDALKDATNEQKKLIEEEVKKFGNEKYSNILKKFLKAEHDKNDPTGIDEKKKQDVDKGLEKYQAIFNILNIVQNNYIEDLKYKVIKDSRKTSFGNLEKILTYDKKEDAKVKELKQVKPAA